jgi:hypothetical protein
MRFAVTQKFGSNAMGLQRTLGVSYSTACNILQKLRRAMIRSSRESLAETVEAGEAYIGGLSEGSPGQAPADKKSPIVLTAELEGAAIRRAKMRQMPSPSGENLPDFVKWGVEPGPAEITDVWRGYSNLEKKGYRNVVKPMVSDKNACPMPTKSFPCRRDGSWARLKAPKPRMP